MKQFFTIISFILISFSLQSQNISYTSITDLQYVSPTDLANCNDTSAYYGDTVMTYGIVVVPGAVFGAVGTCGQRCTSTRRLIIHESVYDAVKERVAGAYPQLKIGNPLDESNHV